MNAEIQVIICDTESEGRLRLPPPFIRIAKQTEPNDGPSELNVSRSGTEAKRTEPNPNASGWALEAKRTDPRPQIKPRSSQAPAFGTHYKYNLYKRALAFPKPHPYTRSSGEMRTSFTGRITTTLPVVVVVIIGVVVTVPV